MLPSARTLTPSVATAVPPETGALFEEEPPEEEPETTVYRPEQPAGVINPYASTGETYENDSGDDVKISGTTKTITVSVHPNSMTLTRAQTDQGIYYGRLYYYDTRDESYKPVIDESRYWYYSTTNRVGTNDVFY